MNILVKQRGLYLNQDKYVCIFIGLKLQKKKATEELQENPLVCGSYQTKEKQQNGWDRSYLLQVYQIQWPKQLKTKRAK